MGDLHGEGKVYSLLSHPPLTPVSPTPSTAFKKEKSLIFQLLKTKDQRPSVQPPLPSKRKEFFKKDENEPNETGLELSNTYRRRRERLEVTFPLFDVTKP